MTIAFLFAGQGSQVVGMGTALAADPEWRALLATADHTLGFPLSVWMAHGPQTTLDRTEIAQPALLTLEVMHARTLMARGLQPQAVAGHSLGQYAALVVAGALDFARAVRLVAIRGRLMQAAVPPGKGTMVAVIGLERAEVYAACTAARKHGVVNVACHNAPVQTVISGATQAVEIAAAACEEAGGSVVPLAVSVPFHCELLAPMVSAFAAEVAAQPVSDPALPVADNVSGGFLTSAAEIRDSLVRQVTAPVRFEENLHTLAAAGVDRVIQCGPGKSLLSFARRTLPRVAGKTFDEALRDLPDGTPLSAQPAMAGQA